MYNLLSNALKYTPQRGSVTVQLTKDHDQLLLSVSDSGPGIEEEKLLHLYQPFMHGYVFQGGMGIGLYMAQQMAILHHGSLVYERKDHETVFKVMLPVDDAAYKDDEVTGRQVFCQSKETLATEELSCLDTVCGDPINMLHVAIIEDDTDMMGQMKEEISTYFRVDRYMDGQEGVEGILANPPSLILCDVMLPKLDGYQVVRQIRSNPQLTNIPVIMLTALDDEGHQIKAYQAGADDYVVKPCNFKVLIARMAQLIRWKRDQKASQERAIPQKQELEEPKILTSVADHHFLENAIEIMNGHLKDPEFTIDNLAVSLHVGRTMVYGKIKKLTGLSPNKYIMKLRMEKAARLLSEGNLNVSEVCYEVGIQEQSYFYRSFKSFYGVSPSEYKKKGGKIEGTKSC